MYLFPIVGFQHAVESATMGSKLLFFMAFTAGRYCLLRHRA
ncbi:hypothetical protein AXX16_3905 [Serratia rubidaea]|nr:hypothetical protein AXX16_3905 [Serratia rubidaea]